ncbi:MAG: hypothetical protein HKN41_13165 [Ilumatobacter sp.]|nr:hypothetical protein [Ilumatobacter sp.]
MSTADAPDTTPAPPVDTLRAPHEPAVTPGRVASSLALLLAGPAIWMAHFWIVYLAAEASCTAERRPTVGFTGDRGLTAIIVVATVIGVGLCVASAFANRAQHVRRADRGDQRVNPAPVGELGRLGLWLAIGAAVSIVAVGLPIVVLAPC